MNDIEEKRRTYDHLNVSTWRVRKAPHPDDIRWRALLIPNWQVLFRVLIINTVLFVFFFFFTTPLAIVGSLRQFLLLDKEDAQDPQNFGSMLHETWFEALVIGFVPTILMAFLSFLIPIFLERATKYEGHHTTSHLDRAAMRKIFTFLFLSNVILPAVFLASLDAVVQIAVLHSPVEVAERLGNVAPNWSFFLNFMINLTFLGSALTLMRLPNWIQMKWKRMRHSIDTDDYFKKSEKFRWGYRYSLNLLVFSIGVFLSTFIPVILPAAALFFVVRLPVDKYNLLVTHNHTRSDFHIMKTVRRIMLIVVGTYQIAVFLFLLFNKHTLGPALLVLGFFAVSIIFAIFDCLGIFHNLSKTETEEWTAVEDEIYKGVGGDILLEAYRDAYLHPGQKET